jgi:2',3'-cyclic-nucleotide 2'-phosphodiesterase (5'-nucleotidase family)
MKRLSCLILAVWLTAGFGWVHPALAATVRITFVQTNDIDRMEERDGRGGFARLMTVVREARAAGPTFFVHSGDTLSPSLLSGIDKGAHIVDILNHMSLDAMTPGNHEFDFGPENFRERMAEAKFPVVTSNIREKDGSQPINTLDDKIVTVDGVRVGFFGLTTEDTPAVSSPGDFTFAPSASTATAEAKRLRDAGADLVVAVVHTPLAVDMELVRSGTIDLVLSGHDEHLLTYFNGRAVLTESESQANFAVVTEITVDKTEKDGKSSVSWWPNFRIVDTATVKPDPEIASLVASYQDRFADEMKVEIGTTETALDSRRATVRGAEAAIGDLVADAMRDAVGADIAITNGGGIRGDRQYPAGVRLTRGDILAELPFNNRTVKLELSGRAILEALENGFSQVDAGAGRFPQVSCLLVTADYSKPAGSRVAAVTIAGVPLDPDKTYTLATNDFMARGGDGYTMLADARVLVSPIDGQLMASQVIDFIARAGTIAPKVEGRIVSR